MMAGDEREGDKIRTSQCRQYVVAASPRLTCHHNEMLELTTRKYEKIFFSNTTRSIWQPLGGVAVASSGDRQKRAVSAHWIEAKRMVRPWLRDSNGKRKKFGGPKKLLACAQTRKPRADGRPHGVMPKRRRGHGWTRRRNGSNWIELPCNENE